MSQWFDFSYARLASSRERDGESQKTENANNWLIDWKGGDLSNASWKQEKQQVDKDNCHCTLEQMDSVAGVLEYMTVLERLKNQVNSMLSARKRLSPIATFLFSQAALHHLSLP